MIVIASYLESHFSNVCFSADSKNHSTLNDSIRKAISSSSHRFWHSAFNKWEGRLLLQGEEGPASFIPYRIFPGINSASDSSCLPDSCCLNLCAVFRFYPECSAQRNSAIMWVFTPLLCLLFRWSLIFPIIVCAWMQIAVVVYKCSLWNMWMCFFKKCLNDESTGKPEDLDIMLFLPINQ